MKIIDLSKPIQYNKNDPWFMKVKIKHKPHRKAKWLIRVLGLPFVSTLLNPYCEIQDCVLVLLHEKK
jgi:hypothetical protein